MILWARARRVPVLLLGLVGLGLLLRWGRGHVVVAPTVIGGGGAAIGWATFVPLLWAAALCTAFESVGSPAEQRPRRHLLALDVALLGGATLAFALTMTIAEDPHAWRMILAHALVLGGLATAVTVLRDGAAGALTATTVVLVTSSYSPHLRGASYARFLQPEGDLVFSGILGILLGTVAVGSLLRAR